MALSHVPVAFARGIVAASGTSVAAVNTAGAAFPVPDNCDVVWVTNPSSTLTGLVGVGTAPAALTAGQNAQRVAPGVTVAMPIGRLGDRGYMNEATTAGSGLIYDSIGGALTLEITYYCRIGSPS